MRILASLLAFNLIFQVSYMLHKTVKNELSIARFPIKPKCVKENYFKGAIWEF